MARARQLAAGLILAGAGLTLWLDPRLVLLGLGLLVLADWAADLLPERVQRLLPRPSPRPRADPFNPEA